MVIFTQNLTFPTLFQFCVSNDDDEIKCCYCYEKKKHCSGYPFKVIAHLSLAPVKAKLQSLGGKTNSPFPFSIKTKILPIL